MCLKIDELTNREQYTVWRKRKKIKLIDVANYIGISVGTISRWERNIKDMMGCHVDKYNKFIKEFEENKSAE